MFKSLFCKHNWEVLSSTTSKSKFEVAMETASKRGVTGDCRMPPQMCDASRVHVEIVTCNKCGALKRFTTHF